MNPNDETKTWEFLAELAAFDGSTEQIEDWVNRCSRKDMPGGFGIVRHHKRKFLERFSKDEMVNIVKATTLLEMNKGFLMGSVHTAIPIIKLIRESHPEECDELDTWVLKNSTNTYLPWGRSRGHFKTWQEVQDDYWTRLAKSAAEEERQEQEHAAKMERDKAKAQHNIYNAIRRKDVGAIEAMIAKGVDLDKPNDEGKSPRAYAEELGNDRVISLLKDESHPKTNQ